MLFRSKQLTQGLQEQRKREEREREEQQRPHEEFMAEMEEMSRNTEELLESFTQELRQSRAAGGASTTTSNAMSPEAEPVQPNVIVEKYDDVIAFDSFCPP